MPTTRFDRNRSSSSRVLGTPRRYQAMAFLLIASGAVAACSVASDAPPEDAAVTQDFLSGSAANGANLVVHALGGRNALSRSGVTRVVSEGSSSVKDQGFHPGEVEAASRFSRTTTLDGTGDRIRVDVARTLSFLLLAGAPQNFRIVVDQDQGGISSGESAFGAPGGSMTSARLAATKRSQLLLYPHLLAARLLASGARATAARVDGQDGRRELRVRIEDDVAPIFLWINEGSHEITRLTTFENAHLRRDVPVDVTYSDWTQAERGPRIPGTVRIRVAGLTVHEETRSRVEFVPDPAADTFAMPPEVTAPVPYDVEDGQRGAEEEHMFEGFASLGIPMDTLDTDPNPTELAPGVHFLQPGLHNQIVVEQTDGLVVIEAPRHPERSKLVLDWIGTRFPGKKITHTIVSHHHEDHSGGARSFVAQGSTLVVGSDAERFWRTVVLPAPSTVRPDPLSLTSAPAKVRSVRPERELRLEEPLRPILVFPAKKRPFGRHVAHACQIGRAQLRVRGGPLQHRAGVACTQRSNRPPSRTAEPPAHRRAMPGARAAYHRRRPRHRGSVRGDTRHHPACRRRSERCLPAVGHSRRRCIKRRRLRQVRVCCHSVTAARPVRTGDPWTPTLMDIQRARFDYGGEPRRLLKTTTSVCPRCLVKVPATVFERAGEIVLEKTCPEHGIEEALLASDAAFYWPRETNKDACGPSGCTLGHSCTLIFEITERCNLTCPTCFTASSPHESWSMTVEDFEQKLDKQIAAGRKDADIVQLSGGEPTIHPDVERMIELAFARGIRRVYVNTNGVRLAKDPAFAARLGVIRKHHDLQLYLQFDGKRDETSNLIRGRRGLPEIKRRAITSAIEQGIYVLPVMTVTRGINLDEIGDVVRVAREHHPSMNTVMLQPAFYAGRYEHARETRRVTVGEIARLVEEQTSGLFTRDDFGPMPCSDPNCFAFAVGLVQNGRVIPISRYFPKHETWHEPDVAARIARFADKMPQNLLETLEDDAMVDTLLDLLASPDEVNFSDYKNFFVIGIKPFMDAHTYDQDRVDRCCVHVIDRGGDPVSLCEYNTLRRPRGLL